MTSTWTATTEPLPQSRGLLVRFFASGRQATFEQVLSAWKSDAVFRELTTQTLRDAPFTGYRWECPPITAATVGRDFECVLLRCDALDGPPDEAPFSDHIHAAGPGASVTAFSTLGKDALLVVPCPRAAPSTYSHLAAFLRGAPGEQVHALWQRVASEVSARLSTAPLWLSTAGMGVAWLHVRLDSRPKYYGYGPYKSEPRP